MFYEIDATYLSPAKIAWITTSSAHASKTMVMANGSNPARGMIFLSLGRNGKRT
jgi:hypothetical protein